MRMISEEDEVGDEYEDQIELVRDSLSFKESMIAPCRELSNFYTNVDAPLIISDQNQTPIPPEIIKQSKKKKLMNIKHNGCIFF